MTSYYLVTKLLTTKNPGEHQKLCPTITHAIKFCCNKVVLQWQTIYPADCQEILATDF